MKTKSALVIEWCEKNKIVDLIVPYRGDIYSYKLAEATTDEDAKLLIGGFDAQMNYHKLPDDIFKVKVRKSVEHYVSEGYYNLLKSGANVQDGYVIYEKADSTYYKSVMVSWEEEEEIK